MKKCILRLWNQIVRHMLMCCALVAVLTSCKTINPPTLHNATQYNSTQQSHDTVVVQDSVHTRDSTFTSERQRGDTIFRERIVYRDRVEWRDRWRTRVERDTIVDVRVEKEVVQLPPERYVPKFYKWCTGLLIAIGLLAIGYGVWALRR